MTHDGLLGLYSLRRDSNSVGEPDISVKASSEWVEGGLSLVLVRQTGNDGLLQNCH